MVIAELPKQNIEWRPKTFTQYCGFVQVVCLFYIRNLSAVLHLLYV